MVMWKRFKPNGSVFLLLLLFLFVSLASGQQAKKWPDAFPKKGADGVPESVDKLTIAVDSWGTSEINPWALTSVSFLGDYFNLRLMMQDPNGDLAAAWATEVNGRARPSRKPRAADLETDMTRPPRLACLDLSQWRLR